MKKQQPNNIINKKDKADMIISPPILFGSIFVIGIILKLTIRLNIFSSSGVGYFVGGGLIVLAAILTGLALKSFVRAGENAYA